MVWPSVLALVWPSVLALFWHQGVFLYSKWSCVFHFKNLFLFLIFSVYLWWKVFFISSVDRIVAPVIPIKLLINLCSLEITSLAENNNSPSVQGLFKFRALAIFPPVFVPFTALPLQGRVGSIVTVFTHLTRRGSLS